MSTGNNTKLFYNLFVGNMNNLHNNLRLLCTNNIIQQLSLRALCKHNVLYIHQIIVKYIRHMILYISKSDSNICI